MIPGFETLGIIFYILIITVLELMIWLYADLFLIKKYVREYNERVERKLIEEILRCRQS